MVLCWKGSCSSNGICWSTPRESHLTIQIILKKKEKKKKNVKLHLQVNVITMTSVIGHNRLRGGRIMSFHWPVNGDWAEFSQSIAHP